MVHRRRNGKEKRCFFSDLYLEKEFALSVAIKSDFAQKATYLSRYE
jgi:putative salt-induced outer membrane protein YdiY